MNDLLKANDKIKALKICAVMCLIATVLSLAGCGLSKDKKSSSTYFGGQTVVKGSENIKPISVSSFFTNVAKNTGIYKIIHNPTTAEIAEEEAVKHRIEAEKEKQALQAA